ncbi:MAG: alpha/beta fold hydrolase [Firmicutes bacterium]|nr:alpha/beta fold hydrolase [Bacillota bacterium]
MKIDKHQIFSHNNEFQLETLIAIPDGNPRGMITFVPGIFETKEMFQPVFEYYTEKQFLCVAYDHRGTGGSVKEKELIGHLGSNGREELIEDIDAILEYTKRLYPGLSTFLVTHDYASLITMSFLKKHDDEIKGLALLNPIGSYSWLKTRKTMIQYLSIVLPTYFKSQKLNEWFYRKVEKQSPKQLPFLYTGKSLTDLYEVAMLPNKKGDYFLKNRNIPIFIGVGEKDHTKGYTSKVKDTLKNNGYHNIDIRYYKEGDHNLFTGDEKEQLLHDLYLFFTLSL